MMRKGWWLFGLICVIWTALVFATAAVITYVMPRKYESVALVQFRPSGADPAKAPAIDGEMLKMRSRPHLLEVARNLELENRWNLPAEKAADLVFSMLVLEKVEGTNLVRVKARFTDREDAKNIAEEVVRVYGEWRKRDELLQNERLSKEHEKAVREQQLRLETRRMESNLNLENDQQRLRFQGAAEARRALEPEEEIYKELRMKEYSLAMERHAYVDPVVMIDQPVVAAAPVSPNVQLNLALGAAAGLVTSLVPAFLLTWLVYGRKRETPVVPVDQGYSRS